MNKLLSNKKFYDYWKTKVSQVDCELWDIKTKDIMTLDKRLLRIKPTIQDLINFINRPFYIQHTEEGLFIIQSEEKSAVSDNLYDALVEYIMEVQND